MSRDVMKAALFWVFLVIFVATTGLAAFATVNVIQQPEASQSLWNFVYTTWSLVFAEIVGAVISLFRFLFGINSTDLTRAISSPWAHQIVAQAKGNPKALDTDYLVTLEWLQNDFKSQGKAWLRELEEQFERAVMNEVRTVESLKTWKPRAKKVDVNPLAVY